MQTEQKRWHYHYLIDDDTCPLNFNFHTHGFPEVYHCPDIQIVIPLSLKIVNELTNCVIKIIENGTKIHHRMFSDKIIKDMNVLFLATEENKHPVLRMILPDKNGCLTPDAEGMFGSQYSDLIL